MLKKTVAMALVFLGMTLAAQDIRVEYLEGKVTVLTGKTWKAADFGQKLSLTQSIKLEGAGVKAILQAPDYRIYLTKPGTYNLTDLKKKWEKTGQGQNILAQKFQTLIGHKADESSTPAAGVRGSPFVLTFSLDARDQELLAPALKVMKEGDYQRSTALLQEVMDNAPAEREGKVLFYLAYSQDLGGSKAQALENLKAAGEFSKDEELFPALALLKARLLLDQGQFEECLAWIKTAAPSLQSPQTLQALKFVEALTYQALDNESAKRGVLKALIALEPSSDIGVLAGSLLK